MSQQVVDSRRQARRQAVVLLYQRDVTGLPIEELIVASERDRGSQIDEFTRALVDGVSVDVDHIDRLITDAADRWTAGRIAPLERNIMRVAVHEILDIPEIPEAVSIDEAVSQAKTFCAAETPAFVNGILGRIAREARAAEDADG